MKTIFIPVKTKLVFNEVLFDFTKIPNNIIIAYSIQFQDFAKKLNNYLSTTHNILGFYQVLGCSNINIPKKTQAIILVSTGRFHGVSLAYSSSLPVYILENNRLVKIEPEEIDSLKIKKKSAFVNFLNAQNVGIIVSTKPGQENLKKALLLKESLKEKKVYNFLTNNINTNEFENFNIKSWINTACPRIDLNLPILNITDLKNFK